MRKKPSHAEDEAQSSLFNILSTCYPHIRQIAFAIPNGGFRNPLEAKRLKAQGVTAGVPDIFVAYPRGPYHGLFIEMKRPIVKGSPKGSISASQKIMMQRLKDNGYRVEVCNGSHEALECILGYWNLPPA